MAKSQLTFKKKETAKKKQQKRNNKKSKTSLKDVFTTKKTTIKESL